MALVFHYPLNDNAASTTVLAGDAGSNTTLAGGDNTADKTTEGPGRLLTRGLELNGVDDYIATSSVSLATVSEWSISLWFRLTSIGEQFFIGQNTGSRTGIKVDNATQISVSGAGGGNAVFTVPTMSTGVWYHLFVSHGNNGTTGFARLSFNGTESVSGQKTHTSIQWNGIGRGDIAGTDSFFAGALAAVRYWNSYEWANRDQYYQEGIVPPGTLVPGSAWDGTADSGYEGSIPTDPERTTFKPVARWDRPHLFRVNAEAPAFVLGVFPPACADTEQEPPRGYVNSDGVTIGNGINYVRFYCEGSTADISAPSFNTEAADRAMPVSDTGIDPTKGVWDYNATFDFTGAVDGVANIYAEIVPHDTTAQSRVLGPFIVEINVNGTRPNTGVVKYVDSTNGNDSTGDGSSGNPFATLSAAVNAVGAAASTDLSGATIKMRAGSGYYFYDVNTSYHSYNGHLIIEPDDGVDRSEVIFDVSGTTLNRWHPYGAIRVRNVTLNASIFLKGDRNTFWWFEGCDRLNGAGVVENTNSATHEIYYTGHHGYGQSGVSNTAFAGLPNLIRGCYMDDGFRSDFAQNCPVVVNCYADQLHPLEGDHPDFFQTTGSGENYAWMNVHGNVGPDAQSLFLSGGGYHRDVAFINVDCWGGNNQISKDELTHFLLWHCSLNSQFMLRDSLPKTYLAISVRNNVLPKLDAPESGAVLTAFLAAGVVSRNNWTQNSIQQGVYWINLPGTQVFKNASVGNLRPLSPMPYPAVKVIEVDAGNNVRDVLSTARIGAWETLGTREPTAYPSFL